MATHYSLPSTAVYVMLCIDIIEPHTEWRTHAVAVAVSMYLEREDS